jgi:uncharacterized membrane protein
MSRSDTALRMVGDQTPLDLATVGTWAVASGAWAASVGNAVQIATAIFALPLVFVLPGYVAVSAAFPESVRSGTDDPTGISPLERAVLSVFVSLLVVPFAALSTDYSPWGIGPATVLFALSVVTLGGTAAAYVRRTGVPPGRRFGVVAGDLRGAVATPGSSDDEAVRRPAVATVVGAIAGDSTGATLLNVVVVLAVVAAAGSVAQAVVLDDGPGSTQTYLLTENESGSLVAADYPTNLTAGEPVSPVVGVENHRRQAVDYTVVVQLQRVEAPGSSAAVAETQSVARFTRTLGPGERALADPTVRPELTGDRLRLVYLVYAGEPPDRPTMANADGEVHLWVSVGEAGSETNVRDCSPECP